MGLRRPYSFSIIAGRRSNIPAMIFAISPSLCFTFEVPKVFT